MIIMKIKTIFISCVASLLIFVNVQTGHSSEVEIFNDKYQEAVEECRQKLISKDGNISNSEESNCRINSFTPLINENPSLKKYVDGKLQMALMGLNFSFMGLALIQVTISLALSDSTGCSWGSDLMINFAGLLQTIQGAIELFHTKIVLKEWSEELKRITSQNIEKGKDNIQIAIINYFIKKKQLVKNHFIAKLSTDSVSLMLLELGAILAALEASGGMRLCPLPSNDTLMSKAFVPGGNLNKVSGSSSKAKSSSFEGGGFPTGKVRGIEESKQILPSKKVSFKPMEKLSDNSNTINPTSKIHAQKSDLTLLLDSQNLSSVSKRFNQNESNNIRGNYKSNFELDSNVGVISGTNKKSVNPISKESFDDKLIIGELSSSCKAGIRTVRNICALTGKVKAKDGQEMELDFLREEDLNEIWRAYSEDARIPHKCSGDGCFVRNQAFQLILEERGFKTGSISLLFDKTINGRNSQGELITRRGNFSYHIAPILGVLMVDDKTGSVTKSIRVLDPSYFSQPTTSKSWLGKFYKDGITESDWGYSNRYLTTPMDIDEYRRTDRGWFDFEQSAEIYDKSGFTSRKAIEVKEDAVIELTKQIKRDKQDSTPGSLERVSAAQERKSKYEDDLSRTRREKNNVENDAIKKSPANKKELTASQNEILEMERSKIEIKKKLSDSKEKEKNLGIEKLSRVHAELYQTEQDLKSMKKLQKNDEDTMFAIESGRWSDEPSKIERLASDTRKNIKERNIHIYNITKRIETLSKKYFLLQGEFDKIIKKTPQHKKKLDYNAMDIFDVEKSRERIFRKGNHDLWLERGSQLRKIEMYIHKMEATGDLSYPRKTPGLPEGIGDPEKIKSEISVSPPSKSFMREAPSVPPDGGLPEASGGGGMSPPPMILRPGEVPSPPPPPPILHLLREGERPVPSPPPPPPIHLLREGETEV
jgi:hypothetical protein